MGLGWERGVGQSWGAGAGLEGAAGQGQTWGYWAGLVGGCGTGMSGHPGRRLVIETFLKRFTM